MPAITIYHVHRPKRNENQNLCITLYFISVIQIATQHQSTQCVQCGYFHDAVPCKRISFSKDYVSSCMYAKCHRHFYASHKKGYTLKFTHIAAHQTNQNTVKILTGQSIAQTDRIKSVSTQFWVIFIWKRFQIDSIHFTSANLNQM